MQAPQSAAFKRPSGWSAEGAKMLLVVHKWHSATLEIFQNSWCCNDFRMLLL
jgi:hypothetical protein